MTGEMIKIFHDLDEKEYVLEENKVILEVLEEYRKFDKEWNVYAMKYLMQKLTSFYEFKYPDVLFQQSTNKHSQEYQNILKIKYGPIKITVASR